jgi:suppressor for copper-sensitivity B
LLSILFIALLGGLILNIMPCVLPVLGIKLTAIVEAPRLKQSEIRRQFIASALGIFVSFWLLAGFILLLKFSGQAIGWGIQFQNPWFIGFMILITAIFALNMLGLFEITLPSNMQTTLATTGKNTIRGHFLQGMFATLLATPCSAPFLGTAVAFAFGAEPLVLFVVFNALALGMALPWLLIAAMPKLARYFPKPGRWMNVVKIIFALLLLITSLWLMSLLANFVSSSYLWLSALLLIMVFLFILAKSQGRAAAIATISALVVIGMLTALLTVNNWRKPLPTDLDWQPLNTVMIAKQLDLGKTVFVDVTADWCITCKANKVGVLLQNPVYSLLKQSHIKLMKGDWTKASTEVTQYLQQYHRFGVPFNIVYGPGAPLGIALPVILSADEVASAIKQASIKKN